VSTSSNRRIAAASLSAMSRIVKRSCPGRRRRALIACNLGQTLQGRGLGFLDAHVLSPGLVGEGAVIIAKVEIEKRH
jgi:hypothetical protein